MADTPKKPGTKPAAKKKPVAPKKSVAATSNPKPKEAPRAVGLKIPASKPAVAAVPSTSAPAAVAPSKPAEASKPAATQKPAPKKSVSRPKSNVRKLKPVVVSSQKPKAQPSYAAAARSLSSASKRLTGSNFFANQSANLQEATMAAMFNTQESAEGVIKLGAEAFQDIVNMSSKEVEGAQKKLMAFGQETVKGFARSADAAFHSLNEGYAAMRDNLDASMESSNALSSLAQEIAAEMISYTNTAIAENIETAKGLFNCRTMHDFIDLQSRLFRTNIDSAFNESVRLSEMVFKYSAQAAEPIHARVAEATDKISRSLAA